jgi:uncharacterized protein YjdB
MVASIDPVTITRWMNLQKFISFACATDASRAQANKGKQASDKSEQRKSSSSGASYKDKLKGKRPNEPSNGQPAKKAKTSQEKQKSEQKAKKWEHNSCFICHKSGHRAKECSNIPKNTRHHVYQDGRETMQFVGKVAGTEVDFLFDSGASTNYVSSAFAKMHGLTVKPSDTNVRLGTGDSVSALRRVLCTYQLGR